MDLGRVRDWLRLPALSRCRWSFADLSGRGPDRPIKKWGEGQTDPQRHPYLHGPDPLTLFSSAGSLKKMGSYAGWGRVVENAPGIDRVACGLPLLRATKKLLPRDRLPPSPVPRPGPRFERSNRGHFFGQPPGLPGHFTPSFTVRESCSRRGAGADADRELPIAGYGLRIEMFKSPSDIDSRSVNTLGG